jgi:cell division protein ZapA (FtsZ GTPase activity inhibitor)
LEKLVTIELFGQSHTIKAETEDTRAEEVADYLVKEVKKIEDQQTGRSPAMSELATLILSALNIANENFELKANQSKFLNEISNRSINLMRSLDDCIP